MCQYPAGLGNLLVKRGCRGVQIGPLSGWVTSPGRGFLEEVRDLGNFNLLEDCVVRGAAIP
jgi:hypothetical protein